MALEQRVVKCQWVVRCNRRSVRLRDLEGFDAYSRGRDFALAAASCDASPIKLSAGVRNVRADVAVQIVTREHGFGAVPARWPDERRPGLYSIVGMPAATTLVSTVTHDGVDEPVVTPAGLFPRR